MTHHGVIYDAYCTTCGWTPRSQEAPPFRSARKHTRVTGHQTIVKKTEVWHYEEPAPSELEKV